MLKLQKIKTLEDYLNEVNYDWDNYVPSEFAIQFIQTLKLIEDGEHKNPLAHYQAVESLESEDDTIILAHRGFAKSTIFGKGLILYLALYGKLPCIPVDIPYWMYISDSIENGVATMRKDLERTINNSKFLQTYIKDYRFTETRWWFKNADDKEFVCKGYGINTGIRGSRELGARPYGYTADDILSDKDAKSETVIKNVQEVMFNAIDKALHPTYRKGIWLGTPFNQNDPLYQGISSGSYDVRVYPVAERFDESITEDNFRGSWPDRFTYKAVKTMYDKAIALGKPQSFYQEMMLRVTDESERLIKDDMIKWYDRTGIEDKLSTMTVFITSDLAVSHKSNSDYAVILVWSLNANGDYMVIDAYLNQGGGLTKHLNALFRLVRKYKKYNNYIQVAVELDGQQEGFIDFIQNKMVQENNYFTLAKEKGKSYSGIRSRSYGSKIDRFLLTEPLFNLRKIWFPIDLKNKEFGIELLNELRNVTREGFKSAHDDLCDAISQIMLIDIHKPSVFQESYMKKNSEGIWMYEDDDNGSGSGSSVLF